VPGLEGASGSFRFGLNSELDYICYNIELYGFPENLNYSSPANTATHIHQAPKGSAGPPRLAFRASSHLVLLEGWPPAANPQYQANGKLQSLGCLIGPFETGVVVNGSDTASGFKVSQIEENPSGFFADTHLGGAYSTFCPVPRRRAHGSSQLLVPSAGNCTDGILGSFGLFRNVI
jgi:hypothetical protein